MHLALGAMASLAPKLGDLLMEEYVVQKGLKDDIESLSRELVAMHAALVDASHVPPDQLTEMEKFWARQVRELSYDMEDAVDDFILRVACRESATATSNVNAFKKMVSKATAMVKKVKDRHQTSDKVRDIKRLSNELAELRAKYTVRESRDKVIRMLTGTKGHGHASDQSLKIVSIVGVGGLGKTTLAKTVYDMHKKTFGCSTCISVGRTPDIPRVFEKMLVKLDQMYKQVNMGRWGVERLCNELHGFLEHKSVIIMTTRNFEVVMKEEEVYKLKPLSHQNSMKLFYKRIQSQEGESLDDKSAKVSSKIIDKCGGVPLPIIAIAKIYESISFGNVDNTKKVLSYSYYDLPSYLKSCLLHLGIYPEDLAIGTNSVIWMWIGEGFVHLDEEEQSISLFEVGERYFKELVNRSMIQPMEDRYTRFTQWFRIHDIVFDLIRELTSDENYITILGSNEQHTSSDSRKRNKKTSMPHLDCKARRLSVQNHPLQTMDKVEVLRSLNIIHAKIEGVAPLDNSFRLCRVISIQNSYVPSGLLKHLGRLLHLKYLEIFNTPIDELPKEIGHLKSLHTLILVNTGLHELPSAVCSLTHLMCLMVKGIKKLPADRMGNLASLEELQLDNVEGQSATENLVVDLGKLTRLRRVVIKFFDELDESLQKTLVQSLCNLRQLQELMLLREKHQQGATMTWNVWEPPRMLRRLCIQGIRFRQLPGWVNSSHLPRLCCLSLQVYLVEVQRLDNLVRLPELSYLKLQGYSWPPGYTVGTDGFKNLSFCRVGTTLKFRMVAMPRLEELQFIVFAGHGSFHADGEPYEQFPTKDVIGDLDFGLVNLLSLEQVTVQVDCWGATAAEVQEVEAVISRAVEGHPNRPTIRTDRAYEKHMISEERREALLQQHIEDVFSVVECKDKPDVAFIIHLRWYRRLQEAVISIDCAGASMREVEKVEKGFRLAAEAHPNHPTIQLIRKNTDKIISSSPDQSNNTEMDYRHDDSLDNSLSKLQLRN
ncbi:hypothetical protein BS78_05G044900 [Paspalum vaginatum]|nr:hypothetical protein BS78_05G044900 [Paspalum vaginatum]